MSTALPPLPHIPAAPGAGDIFRLFTDSIVIAHLAALGAEAIAEIEAGHPGSSFAAKLEQSTEGRGLLRLLTTACEFNGFNGQERIAQSIVQGSARRAGACALSLERVRPWVASMVGRRA